MVSSTCLVPFHQGLIPRGCVDLLHGYIDKLFTKPYNYISHIGCLGDLFHEYRDKLFTRPYDGDIHNWNRKQQVTTAELLMQTPLKVR